MPKLRVCLLWHMHQPVYRDPSSGEYILPWVRLHATRSYYDMARVLARHEGARAVINLVPSLLQQLDEYARGQAQDRFLRLTRKPADELDPGERAFILKNFFLVDWETCVRPLPRYWELLHKRGRDLRGVDLARVAQRFATDEMRDLQLLFNLAWMGFSAYDEEEAVRALAKKGRQFTEEDKGALLDAQARIVRRVMPALAAVQKSGQAELTVTPFYHPILPLLVDSDSARRAMPRAELPVRFAFPDDAKEQVRRALDFAERHFGSRPSGMWPAEGGVSPEAVAVLASEGVRWCATDEGVLLKSRPARDRNGGALVRPYRLRTAAGDVSMLFRDRGLSDLIGFTYAKSPARDALDDLFKHLDTIGRAAPKGEVPLVTIALDGENAWEHYPNSGHDFLDGLYRRLAGHEGGVEPVKAGEHLAASPPTETIDELHTGSWIDSNFRIWIGHPEDNLGWTLLGDARRAVAVRERETAAGKRPADPGAIRAAKDALLVAEGSDWFWWYGDDFTTESSAEFDALFRGYVKEAWKALGEPVPPRLDDPISHHARPAGAHAVHEPQGFIRPRLDGEIKSYFDWIGAGCYRPDQVRGTMFQSEGLYRALYYGFDETTLYLRLDPSGGRAAQGDESLELRVHLVAADRRSEVQIPMREVPPQPRLVFSGREGDPELGRAASGPPAVGRAACRDILEVALPFGALGLASGARASLAVQVLRGGVEIERLPRYGTLEFGVPDEEYERKNWKV